MALFGLIDFVCNLTLQAAPLIRPQLCHECTIALCEAEVRPRGRLRHPLAEVSHLWRIEPADARPERPVAPPMPRCARAHLDGFVILDRVEAHHVPDRIPPIELSVTHPRGEAAAR